jgi:hypothetical protein
MTLAERNDCIRTGSSNLCEVHTFNRLVKVRWF